MGLIWLTVNIDIYISAVALFSLSTLRANFHASDFTDSFLVEFPEVSSMPLFCTGF